MPIKSLFMPCVDAGYSALDLIDAFYDNGIATISRVAYKPYILNKTLYYRAYINVYEWHDTESAYNFIKSLQTPRKETRFVYQDDNWYVVRIDERPWLTDLEKCYVTINWLLEEGIDVHDHRGFDGLKPIDSYWDELRIEIGEVVSDITCE